MKKINTYCYRFIVWVNLFVLSVGCIYHAKNDMVPSLSPPGKKRADGSSNSKQLSEFDIVQGKINDLLKQFNECCCYIHGHRADYSSNNIIRVDADFQGKQRKDNHQQRNLMLYNAISTLDGTRIAQDKIKRIQTCKVSSSTLDALFYLKNWELARCERLMGLINHEFMKLNDFSQVAEDCVAIKMKNMMHKQLLDTKVYSYTNLQKTPVELFSSRVLDYLYHDLLPYWGKVVDLLLFHALNTSVAQGKMAAKEAQRRYQVACQAIASICDGAHIQALEACCRAKVQKIMQCRLHKKNCSFTKIFEELKQFILQPIEEMYTNLVTIMNRIEYSDDAKLKEQVFGSLTLLYHIAYAGLSS